MATKKKMLQAAAGNATGGEALNVEDVFSTYLYTGTGSTQTITNGIDLDGEGGMVWFKAREIGNYPPVIFDTNRGVTKYLRTSEAFGEQTSGGITAFNSDGFDIAGGFTTGGATPYVSWTFRKAPKFFDVVTYTGDGVLGRDIAHNLGCAVGTIFVKRLDLAREWVVYHRSLGATKFLQLNTTDAELSQVNRWNDTEPTDSVFTVGNNAATNADGGTYVAYLFAHNDGDGGFGPNGDADIIKCGGFTGTGSSVAYDIGFEPQWVLWKQTNAADDWYVSDNMRGLHPQDINAVTLRPNQSAAENASGRLGVTSTGFEFLGGSGDDYIYIAIRRGTKVPESGTEVFEPVYSNNGPVPTFRTGFPVDLTIHTPTNGANKFVATRLLGPTRLRTDSILAEDAQTEHEFDYMNGSISYVNLSGYIGWNWKRAPKFFDVVAYTGDGTAGRTVSHNLGVAPEMIWVKQRDVARNWAVYHSLSGGTHRAKLSQDLAYVADSRYWNDTDTTSSVFTLGDRSEVNQSSGDYISYLFSSLDGISKVGSYTGNGGTQTIDCGFTSGARFILIKRTDSTGDWYVWDTERGIVAANDPHLSLNTTAAEVTSDDSIDPDSSGFIVNQVAVTNINVSSASYIFYAIA